MLAAWWFKNMPGVEVSESIQVAWTLLDPWGRQALPVSRVHKNCTEEQPLLGTWWRPTVSDERMQTTCL
ncbi:hypothetical protein LEN26_020458 [Aphanomyces euteiches]|nr:hypothetical protein LEN26_020458 [Aphanomyces euteiches]KAH9115475.1 hypothetical protein AeMF1_010490 [Aphanomyces euteiches]KAH9142158.1 hypothetical protein AeRB84_013747 [Aphanomyces euteiches]KAH9190140.1 hypothetical protein AeNC1_007890 [Aphanomyces euteiches]